MFEDELCGELIHSSAGAHDGCCGVKVGHGRL